MIKGIYALTPLVLKNSLKTGAYMSHTVIDRRKNDKGKSTTNRRKFVKRVNQQVRDAVKDVIRDGSVGDIVNSKEKKVKIPGKGLSHPTFRHDKKGGRKEQVHPGNKEFNQGDRIPRPPEQEGGKGREGSPDGEGEDAFSFNLTKEEFLDMFFEDLELPDMIKKDIVKVDEWENRRAGFSVDGNPSRVNILQTMKKAKGRRLGLRSKKRLRLAELLLELSETDVEDTKRIEELNDEINALKRKIAAVPFIDDVDLRYNRWEKVPVPTTQAVMFGIMDVSGSMGEWEKEMAKRFFMLMLLFLHYNYERVDIVWIRHHTSATEVDEDEFFHSHETGGTLVSSALRLMNEIIVDRYPLNQWNIFGCQISDGDNWGRDNIETGDLLRKHILPKTQYFAYVEVDQYRNRDKDGGDSDLWPYYEKIKGEFSNLEMASVTDVTEIYPIFRRLFEKRGAS